MVLNSPCWVLRDNDQALRATIIQQRGSEYYVHYDGRDKRLDEWVPASTVELIRDSTSQTHESHPDNQGATRAKKRNRMTGPSLAHSDGTPATVHDNEPNSPATLPSALGPSLHTRDQTEAAQQHRALTAQRNFDRVNFGQWHIKTWYFSPYPSFDDETDAHTRPRATPEGPAAAAQGAGPASLSAVTPAAHHTSAAAGTAASGDATLWVCDRCFKYMREATAWELHKTCKVIHPPGRKVYQRGAHTIWEVDGQVERLYCQNLSLFGKLFIDVKTLFFDTEHFMFYILTDADAHRDHFLAYFSQEKVSYDDYNLACIVTLPPYQKRGYGMLLIEFSYELSRRAGKLGTPERPLSDLGLRSYVSFWIAVLVRFFRTITPLPVEDEQADLGSRSNPTSNLNTTSGQPAITEPGSNPLSSSTAVRPDQQRHLVLDSGARRSSTTVEHGRIPRAHSSLVDAFGEISYHTRSEGGDSAEVGVKHRTVRCGLEDIAYATHLRPDDIALALREAGLLTKRRTTQSNPAGSSEHSGSGGEAADNHRENTANGIQEAKSSHSEVQIVITREMIEAVARERKVKPAYLDRAFVLL